MGRLMTSQESLGIFQYVEYLFMAFLSVTGLLAGHTWRCPGEHSKHSKSAFEIDLEAKSGQDSRLKKAFTRAR